MLYFIQSHSLQVLPELIDGLPNISGWEAELCVRSENKPVFLPTTNIRGEVSAVCAIALHMHQPTVLLGSRRTDQ